MTIRYFDCQGRQLSFEELRTLNISTPIMEHVVASVIKRAKNKPKMESVPSLDKQVDDINFI